MTGNVTVEEIEGLNKPESRKAYEAVLKLLVNDQLPVLLKRFGGLIKDVKHGLERIHFIFSNIDDAGKFAAFLKDREIPVWHTEISVRLEIKHLVKLQNKRVLPRPVK